MKSFIVFSVTVHELLLASGRQFQMFWKILDGPGRGLSSASSLRLSQLGITCFVDINFGMFATYACPVHVHIEIKIHNTEYIVLALCYLYVYIVYCIMT